MLKILVLVVGLQDGAVALRVERRLVEKWVGERAPREDLRETADAGLLLGQ
jgi:hypothetical protein